MARHPLSCAYLQRLHLQCCVMRVHVATVQVLQPGRRASGVCGTNNVFDDAARLDTQHEQGASACSRDPLHECRGISDDINERQSSHPG